MSKYETLQALADIVPINKSDAVELLPLMIGYTTDNAEAELKEYQDTITKTDVDTRIAKLQGLCVVGIRERVELRNKKNYGVKQSEAMDMSRTITYPISHLAHVSSVPPFHLTSSPPPPPSTTYSLLSKPKHFYSDECSAIYDALSEVYRRDKFDAHDAVDILGIMLNMEPNRAASQLKYMVGKGYLRGEE